MVEKKNSILLEHPMVVSHLKLLIQTLGSRSPLKMGLNMNIQGQTHP
jgi:hypothetical protein